MPRVRVEIDGQIKTGPSENLPALLKAFPNAKVLGPAEPNLGQRIVSGLTYPGRKLEEFSQQLPISPLTFPIKAAAFMAPKTGTELALTAGTELGLPLVGKAFKVAAPVAGKLLAGVRKGATERIIEKAMEGKPILPALKKVDIEERLLKAVSILEESRKRLGAKVGEIVDAFSSKFGDKIVNAGEVASDASNQMVNLGLRGHADIARSGVFGSPSNTRKFKSIVDEIASNPNLPPKRLYELKTQAQDVLEIPMPGTPTSLKDINKQGARVIENFTKGIDNLLEGVVVGFKEANKRFSNKASVYSILKKELLGGDAVKKSKQLLEPNSKINQSLRGLEKATASDLRVIDKIKDAIAASESGSLISDIPRTGFGAYMFGSRPEVVIHLLASTSPTF